MNPQYRGHSTANAAKLQQTLKTTVLAVRAPVNAADTTDNVLSQFYLALAYILPVWSNSHRQIQPQHFEEKHP